MNTSGEVTVEELNAAALRVKQMEVEIKAKKKEMKKLQQEIDQLKEELEGDLKVYDQHVLLRFLNESAGKKDSEGAKRLNKELRRLRVAVKLNEDELEALARSFRVGITLKPRKYHHKVFPDAFTGVEAIDWLIENWPRNTKLSRAQAVWVGNLLLRTGLFCHVSRILPFHDKDYYYVFKDNKALSAGPDLSSLKPFIGLLSVSLKDVRGLKEKANALLHLVCDYQWYKIRIRDWLQKPDLKLYFYITRSNSELFLKALKKFRTNITLHTLSIDEEVVDWYSLQSRKRTGPYLQLSMHYTFLTGKDEGFGLPPLPFNPKHWCKTEAGGGANLGFFTQTKKAGHRPIHRCCALNNIALPVSDQSDWDKLKPAEGKPGRSLVYGVFCYGNVTAFNMVKEEVEVFIQSSPPYCAWSSIGVTETRKDGRMELEIPFDKFPIQKSPGHYPIRATVLGDHSLAAGQLWVLNWGVGGVLYDIDGTLTPGDDQIILEMALNSFKKAYDPNLRPGAVALCRAWAAKGYLPIYLSGRSGSTYNLTREWLVAHGFPPGLILHTDKHAPTLPIYSSVGVFKRDHIFALQKMVGMEFIALYGNTMTDVRAYEEAGHPKETTFIVGKFGGKGGTFNVGYDFVEHVQYVVEKFPDAAVPAPRDFFDW